MRKKLSIALMFILGVVLGALVCVQLLSPEEEESKIHPEMREAYNATCRVQSRRSKGSGVLLNTGYILTARHCVDDDMDGKITPDERTVQIEFYGDTAEVSTATVTAIGSNADFALLKPEKNIRSNIPFAKEVPDIGEKICTIGLMAGETPHITSGFISTPTDSKLSKTSCYISFGNSGGGLFDDTNRVVGVVNAIRMQPVRGRLHIYIPSNGHLMSVHGSTRHMDELNCMAFYVPIDTIREELMAKNLLVLVDGPPKQPFWGPWEVGLATTLLQVFLIGLFIGVFRKYIFSKQVR